ncbi:MAG: TetR/AcrR family transcriptional regulator C-terminal ligand-binding domain-containing protein [Frankiaceae bacterium]|nr:TetR/AcrR family transcriptional regulator C-terminal ligand-binding domain-containing protein [Frankiaceae bacterium]
MNLAAVRSAGRPRDEARDAAILDATLDVLGEVGYDRLTIDAVAAKAKASKATVYRRWPGKPQLVVDAFLAMKARSHSDDGSGTPQVPWPDTGTLRGDLVAGCRNFIAKLDSDEGKLILAVMTAQARDPELAAAMRSATSEDKRKYCRMVAERAIERGELSSAAGVDTFTEVLPAMMFNRLLLSDEPFDDAFINHVVDDIALPLLGHHAKAGAG